MLIHGEAWTLKELYTYPNEQIYWSVQVVLYPFMTGLVAGAFILSSLYYVFGRKELKVVTNFSLIFSLALLITAPMTLQLHLQHPLRGWNIFLTPHFSSAIAAFSIVFFTYGAVVASEVWFAYRSFFVESATALKDTESLAGRIKWLIYKILSLGTSDLSEEALKTDKTITKILAGVGMPVAFLLHGYAGFIFGSVKANELWLTPLMPIIFLMSAVVSGVALCIFTYIIIMEIRYFKENRGLIAVTPSMRRVERRTDMNAVRSMAKYLVYFMIVAVGLEMLDLVFHIYTGKKAWDILESIIFGRSAFSIFVLQYGIGSLVPFILLLLPNLSIKRAFIASTLVLFGIFMMRWNVVIGGQSFSLSYSGYMNYVLPIIPHDIETLKEGLFGMLFIFSMPFALLYIFSKIFPLFKKED